MELFSSLSEWWCCVKSAAVHLVKGLYQLVQAVVMGLVSLVCALWRYLVSLVGKYPNIALGGFLVSVVIVWLITFMSMRARAVGAEAQRDAVGYEFQTFRESHGYE